MVKPQGFRAWKARASLLLVASFALGLGCALSGAQARSKLPGELAPSGTAGLPQVKFATGAELKARYEALARAAGENRTAGAEGDRRAHDWILAQVKALSGWTVTDEPFKVDVKFAEEGYQADFAPFANLDEKSPGYVKNKRALDELSAFARGLEGKPLANVVLSKAGSDPKQAARPLIVTAHFDTITWRRTPFEVLADAKNPGANDNGASVAALLGVAEALKGLKPRRPVELVFTDGAEAYFQGARAHGAKIAAADARADCYTLEMIGWNQPNPDIVSLYIRSEGQPGFDKDKILASALAPALNSVKLNVRIVRNNTDRAEHFALRKTFHSAVLVSHDWEYGFDDSHYHTSRDSEEIVDWDYAARIGKAVAIAVTSLALKK